MLARNLWSRATSLVQPSYFKFSTTNGPKRYFMVEYVYTEDSYYKKSKYPPCHLIRMSLVPHRENHLKALDSLKQTADAKLISSPFFPDNGSIVMV